MSSAALRHLELDFNIHVIGASHLVQCGRWSELLSCAIGSETAPVFSIGPDFAGKQPFEYRDRDLRFEFKSDASKPETPRDSINCIGRGPSSPAVKSTSPRSLHGAKLMMSRR